ncbi:MAG: leucyl aminopeptidase family protein [Burkholderiaceae bacterium]|nr:leucyl aminopeptidase family protein [Rhodoferax sp.]MCP5285574.1 leucyl aminopeptidase family protein [Burkholderiaceae bacterium]
MTVELKTPGARAVPIHVVDRASFATHLRTAPAATQRWLKASGFQGEADRHLLVPEADGSLKEVWAGVPAADSPWVLSALPTALPPGTYRIADDGLEVPAEAAALSWELGGYTFDAYKATRREPATLQLAPGVAAERGLMLATAIASVRDLVNTPAEHLGPEELGAGVKLVAKQHGAKVKETVGDALLKANFPAIHAVGRAAVRAPRLIELTWGNPKHPKLSIVGKGVCFDSGGLDLKSADGMRLMKKDMGGAANALGLAQMVMALKLPVRLQLLIPAVENAVAGNAFRPGDVFRTRSGLHIEIGNTDAEGRVILCDALAYAAESKPALIIDLATLTGAARVALGPALPALFCRDTALARELMDSGLALQDPLWHLPLWDGYHAGIESPIADIVNTGRNAMGGAINAALFLADFVPRDLPWLHIDLFSWNDQARPGRPVGGEAQTLRTLLQWLERRFG